MKIRLSSFLLLLLKSTSNGLYSSSVEGDLEEGYEYIYSKKGKIRAELWISKQLVRSLPLFLINNLIWRVIMFKNYLKITFRNFKRQKGFSFINIFGLATGMACCIFILLFVQYELGYDSYHKDADRIYRIAASVNSQSGLRRFAAVIVELGPTVKEKFPEIEYCTRFRPNRDSRVKYRDRIFKEEAEVFKHTEPDIFNIFKFSFKQGDPMNALVRPYTAVITERIAEKYFGAEEAVGKTLMVDTVSYEITGVIENLPGNSILQSEVLMSWKSIENDVHASGWDGGNTHTFIKIAPGVDTGELATKITNVAVENMREFLQRDNAEYTNFLQPLKFIHLNSNLIWEFRTPGDVNFIYIFSGIVLFILIIASINFINLSTARSANRSGEVGVRKVVGAAKKQLIAQFIGESVLITVISLMIAVVIAMIFLPVFTNLTLIKIEYKAFLSNDILLGMAALVVVTGVIAGSYPALFLSSFNPVFTIKGTLNLGTKSGLFRKVLVIAQFVISIALIIGTLIFYQQLSFMKNKPLGFSKDQKLIINMEGNRVNPDNYQLVKGEFLKNPSVLGASFSSSVPGRWRYRWRQWPTGQRATNLHEIRCMQVDHDFFELYDLKIIAGRGFNEKMATERTTGGYIFNETAVKTYGWNSPEEAITKTLRDVHSPIIGVMKDYHFAGLQQVIEPLGIFHMVEDYRYLTLKVDSENLNQVIQGIEEKYGELYPNAVFDYFFLDQDFNKQYLADDKKGELFRVFAFLGIFIACMGLFGLASFMAEQRTKEIGIRKVLGASSGNVVKLLTREFLVLLTIANIISWPISWFALNRWLQSYAYRADISILSFVLAGILAVIIALLTVSYQTFKAANTKPVDSLRYE